ncbi:MAG TPA: alpha/beta hydrolase [Pirellulaceae bacterium]|nr:alpha/beta hydrolase [Pirellulaceae bacterium]
MIDNSSTPVETASSVVQQTTSRSRILSRLRRWAYRGTAGFVGLYVLLIVVLVTNETSLVYPAPPFDPSKWSPLPSDVEEMWCEMENGWQVHGWYLTHPAAERVILHCHGNAEDVAGVFRTTGRELSERLQANVLIFDYPGFGQSHGSPSEETCIESGNLALAWLCERTDMTPDQIILYWRSLGGGIAVALAQRHGAKALILDRTFDSITNPGAARYPWAPVKLLMRNRYPSAERIRDCAMPCFISHFEGDEVVPIWSGQRLYESATAASKREFVRMPGGNHLAPLPASYWPRLNKFLQEIESVAIQSQLLGSEQ